MKPVWDHRVPRAPVAVWGPAGPGEGRAAGCCHLPSPAPPQ